MTTEPFDPNVYHGNQGLKQRLEAEAAATRKYLEYQHKADEWKKYRDGLRSEILAITGNAPIVKVDGVPVLTSTPKSQFSGTRFAAEYPGLAEAFTVPRTVMEIDVEALRSRHPDIAAKFTTHAFTNKLA